MGPYPAHILKEWRDVTRYSGLGDWVFAGKRTEGRQPIWGQTVMRQNIVPAARRLDIFKQIGWHTFLHSYSTLLRFLGTNIKVQQDLLRHSSARRTLDTHTQLVTTAKRHAQDAVVQLLLANGQRALAAPGSAH